MLAAAATAAAQSVIVIVESSHGGAGNGLMNESITVPLNTIYTSPALDAVSTLYLTQSECIELGSVTCTPHRDTDGTGVAGLPFNSTSPSFISTNTEQIGSLVCISSGGSSSSSTSASITSTVSAFNTPTYSNATTTARNATSVLLTIVSESATASPSTLTSIATFSGVNGPTTSTCTSVVDVAPTTSAEASLNSEAAAPTKHVASWVAGAAVAGLGLMAAW
ncbi:hypothetical protein Slin14017_G074180 [Septoria linicola]|nr:hypothetical protein Slin14017_G074180 [Septoria linicola]